MDVQLYVDSLTVTRSSTFMDIIISGLVGLRAAFGKFFVVEPLADASIDYFALDNVACASAIARLELDPVLLLCYALRDRDKFF